jgi:hypothetical protein
MNTCSNTMSWVPPTFPQIQWRELASFTSPIHKKQYMRNSKFFLNFMRQRCTKKKIYEKEWKTWHMMSCLMTTSYPSSKTCKKRREWVIIHVILSTYMTTPLLTHVKPSRPFTLETRWCFGLGKHHVGETSWYHTSVLYYIHNIIL